MTDTGGRGPSPGPAARLLRPLTRFALASLLPRQEATPGLADVDVDGFLDQLEAEAPLLYKVGLYGGSLLLWASPAVTVGRPLPACALAPETLERHVNALATHRVYPVRQLMFALKMIAGLCWGQDHAVRADLGVAPLARDPGTWRKGPPAAGGRA